jgi:DNA-binding NarL/FixJ family response regulator
MICEQTTTRPGSTPQPPEGGLAAQLVTPLSLIGQTVGTALRSRGVAVDVASRGPHHPLGPAVVVVIDDLVDAADVRRVVGLLRSTSAPVLVLTGRPRGRYWGALVSAGACSILPSAVSLDELVEALAVIQYGGRVLSPEECDELLEAWQEFVSRQDDARARLARLTPREQAVLDGMRAGGTVAELAALLDVREATVRTHVRAILRKLGVRSQLAAVAVAQELESPLLAAAAPVALPRRQGAAAAHH